MVHSRVLGFSLASLSQIGGALRAEQTAPHTSSLMARMKNNRHATSHAKRHVGPDYAVTACDSIELNGNFVNNAPDKWFIDVKDEQQAAHFTSRLKFEADGNDYKLEWCLRNKQTGETECSDTVSGESNVNYLNRELLNMREPWTVNAEFANGGADWKFNIHAGSTNTIFYAPRQNNERYLSAVGPEGVEVSSNLAATSPASLLQIEGQVATASGNCFHYHNAQCGDYPAVTAANFIRWKFDANFNNVFSDSQCISCSTDATLKLKNGKLAFESTAFSVTFEKFFESDTTYSGADSGIEMIFDGSVPRFALLVGGSVVETKDLQGVAQTLALQAGKVGCSADGSTQMEGSVEGFTVQSLGSTEESQYYMEMQLTEGYPDALKTTSSEADSICGMWETCVGEEKTKLTSHMCQNYLFSSHDTQLNSTLTHVLTTWASLETFQCNDVENDCLAAFDQWETSMDDMLAAVQADWGICGHVYLDFLDKHYTCRTYGYMCESKRCKMGQDLITLLLDFKYLGSFDQIKSQIAGTLDIQSIDGTEVRFKHQRQTVPTLNHTDHSLPDDTEYSAQDVSSPISVKLDSTQAFTSLSCPPAQVVYPDTLNIHWHNVDHDVSVTIS